MPAGNFVDNFGWLAFLLLKYDWLKALLLDLSWLGSQMTIVSDVHVLINPNKTWYNVETFE